jgi:hypothetical protein
MAQPIDFAGDRTGAQVVEPAHGDQRTRAMSRWPSGTARAATDAQAVTIVVACASSATSVVAAIAW